MIDFTEDFGTGLDPLTGPPYSPSEPEPFGRKMGSKRIISKVLTVQCMEVSATKKGSITRNFDLLT